MRKTMLWIGALIVGAIFGFLQVQVLDDVMTLVATIYTRMFQLLAVPTIVLAVVTTLATMGTGRDTGRIFRRTLVYTLLTTLAAAVVGAVLYVWVAPSPLSAWQQLPSQVGEGVGAVAFSDHLLNIIPNNIVKPFLEGNVLSLLLIAFAVGIGLSRLPESENKQTVLRGILGLQELLFLLIRGLVWTLPLGIVAFSAQLAAQVLAGVATESLGKYVLVILGGNAVQFFIVLPLFLLARKINPVRVLGKMSPAVLMALFTKSSAATLPVTIDTAEQRLGVSRKVARFVLPICTTINMNGCAAFILVTSLFVMQSGGIALTPGLVLLWIAISVVSAIGNAGVPMGCYFLTFSLMSGIGAPVSVLGLILPIYTIIDMVETAENVWSDSCVCAMTDHDVS